MQSNPTGTQGVAQQNEIAAIKAHGLNDAEAQKAVSMGIGSGVLAGWITKYGPLALQILKEILAFSGGGAVPAAAKAP
jgi:hypothetical protein